jgi:hypothetical protein
LFVAALSGVAPWAGTAPPALRLDVGDDVPATATDLRAPGAQNSPVVVADPSNAQLVVLAHRQDAPEFGCGLQVSGDGGRSWVPTQPVPKLPEGAERCYAPEIAFDGRGRLYYLFVGLAGLGNNPVGAYLTFSTDNGRTFGPPRQLLGPKNYQIRMALDREVGDRGRIHLVWLQAADSLLGGLPDGLPNPLMSAYSDDGGATFSTPVQVSDPDRPRSIAPAIAVGRDSAVHIAYFDLRDDLRDYQGLEGPPWDGAWSVVVTSSYDRGRTFGTGVVVDDGVVPTGRVMLIYTMAPPTVAADGSGRVYVGWADSRHGDPDVLVARSRDGGRTFAAPRRANDDPVGSGRDQYLPRLSVAEETGRVDLVFLDRRDDAENLRNDAFFTYSTDGGAQFAPNVKLSTEPSDSRVGQRYLVRSAEGLYEIGGRLGLFSRPSAAIAAWPDTRNAAVGTTQQDVFTARVTIAGDDVQSGSGTDWLPLASGAAAAVVVGGIVAVLSRRRRSVSSSSGVS